MARPAITVILVSRHTFARVDASRAVSGKWTAPRPEADLLAAVETAINFEPALGRQTFVLATDVWTEIVTWPASRALGLNAEEIAAALNFETESHSGVNAFDAVVAYVPRLAAAGQKAFWLTQVKTADRDGIEELLQRHGSRLGGILHPAGEPGGGRRVELWPDVVAAVTPTAMHIVTSDPTTGRWRGEVDAWLVKHGGPAGTVGIDDIPADLAFDDETFLFDWLGRWAAALVKTADVPIVRPLPKAITPRQRTLIGAGLAAVVAAACFATWFHFDRKQQALEKQFADGQAENEAALARTKADGQRALAAKKDEWKGLEKDTEAANRTTQVTQRTEYEEKVERLKEQESSVGIELKRRKKRAALQVAELKAQEEELATLSQRTHKYGTAALKLAHGRVRFAELLKELGDRCPEDVVLQSVRVNDGEVKVVGVTLDLKEADRYARELEMPLKALGWAVRLPKESPVDVNRGPGPWSFEVTFGEPKP